jgi:hypothetical protein
LTVLGEPARILCPRIGENIAGSAGAEWRQLTPTEPPETNSEVAPLRNPTRFAMMNRTFS